MTAEEPFIFNGVPWAWDDAALPECGLCHDNRLLPYAVERGLSIEGKEVVLQICESCRDFLLEVI